MATASAFIGQMTSEGSIANMGVNLARGTVISIALVMFVLPQLLLVGIKIIEKTSFSVSASQLKNTIAGDVDLEVLSNIVQEEEKNEA